LNLTKIGLYRAWSNITGSIYVCSLSNVESQTIYHWLTREVCPEAWDWDGMPEGRPQSRETKQTKKVTCQIGTQFWIEEDW